MEKNQVSAYLDARLFAWLDAYCKRTKRTKTGLIEFLLEKERNRELAEQVKRGER